MVEWHIISFLLYFDCLVFGWVTVRRAMLPGDVILDPRKHSCGGIVCNHKKVVVIKNW